MKHNPFRVVVPSQIPLSDRGSDNDEYNKPYIWRLWIEGSKDVNEISAWLDLHPDEVLRLMDSLEISFSDRRCSICRFRSHVKSRCPKNRLLTPEERFTAQTLDDEARRFPSEEE